VAQLRQGLGRVAAGAGGEGGGQKRNHKKQGCTAHLRARRKPRVRGIGWGELACGGIVWREGQAITHTGCIPHQHRQPPITAAAAPQSDSKHTNKPAPTPSTHLMSSPPFCLNSSAKCFSNSRSRLLLPRLWSYATSSTSNWLVWLLLDLPYVLYLIRAACVLPLPISYRITCGTAQHGTAWQGVSTVLAHHGTAQQHTHHKVPTPLSRRPTMTCTFGNLALMR
jgi:hypothetical protein